VAPLVGKRVVILEEFEADASTLDETLRRAGAQSVARSTLLQSSVDVAAAERPDLVLIGVTDANVPDALQAIRQIALDPTVCIVVVTDHVSGDADRELRDAGVAEIFRRPFTAAELVPALEETFRQHCSGPSTPDSPTP
jgi:AmiR/NasT family two-component response regulator